jgi:nitrate reductase cytochrome c-type subunit
VAVGTPVYLEVEINKAIPLSNVVSVTWALTNRPVNSAAALTASPLGTNVPVYEPTDRLIYEVAGRSLLRPDVRGQYTVTATIVTTTSGTTNVSRNITAGVYMGINTCALCHSGGTIADEKVQPWQTTAHSMIFTEGINGLLGSYSVSCLKCHTVGYDTNTNAVNGGFDDVATQTGWTFPTNLVPSNFTNMPPALQNLANIQCENCHGPGSEHAYSLGDTNLITITVNSGDCNQCHDAPTHHIKGTEWYASLHAVTTRTPSGAGREVCVGCHTSDGFVGRISGATTTNNVYSAIACVACHEPHGQTIPTNNPHLIRTLASVTMGDGTVVTNAGEGLLCLECHHSRNGSATNNVANYPKGLPTWAGGSSFGPHDGPQGDMVLGVNAITYGQNIPSSAHRTAITNLCVTCHMQATATTDPGFLVAGGHTFEIKGTNSSGVSVQLTAACVQCHGPTPAFDLVEDYEGNGTFQGVQEEVQGLLNTLSTYLPNSSGVVDGTVKTSLSVKTNWTQAQLNAAYNFQFVSNDGSLGIHNAPFAVGLLQASIADVSGAAANNAALQAWEIQYFGSTTNASAGPNAAPAGDGIPNWLKYALGLNPLIKGLSVPNGVVWANTGQGGATNTLQIYTAAEVNFPTVVGTMYQIQGITSLGGTWQNIGAPIAGTGQSISYLTPTRNNVQQFYRVMHTP